VQRRGDGGHKAVKRGAALGTRTAPDELGAEESIGEAGDGLGDGGDSIAEAEGFRSACRIRLNCDRAARVEVAARHVQRPAQQITKSQPSFPPAQGAVIVITSEVVPIGHEMVVFALVAEIHPLSYAATPLKVTSNRAVEGEPASAVTRI
jgi:hypothetical protein